jgi:hypothetical protein
MQRAAFRAALAEALKGRILAADGIEPQLHMVYLANDSLFNRVCHIFFFRCKIPGFRCH